MSEREIEIPEFGNADENSRHRQNASDHILDSESSTGELREAGARSDASRISIDDLDPSLNGWSNQEYGEVM